MGPDIAEMLRQRLGGELGQKIDRPPRPWDEAQIDDLRARWAAHNRSEDLQPGDLIVAKPGLSTRKPEYRTGYVHMFWRRLDFATWHDRMLASVHLRGLLVDRLDCLVAYIGDDDALVIEPSEMATWERRAE